eukprot:m.599774 g.599774  ORF g.599774 m.599774 type:complete len:367 (+) comp58079_c0_seq29:1152-2252(+)
MARTAHNCGTPHSPFRSHLFLCRWTFLFTIPLTAFGQVFMECRLKHEFKDVLRKAHDFIDVSQIRVNHPEHERYYRSITKGGWPFSTHDMGWIVADCTGEGLKAALLSKKHHYTDKPLSDDRFFDAVNIILVMQNSTGGWSTCEENRGWHFFEWFNASEVFGEIMIDYDYVECSSSALQALCVFREMYPQHRTREVNAAIDNAAQYILRAQRADGSWEGMWGVCFTYGAWFAIEGLIDAGIPHTHPSIQRGCKYLLSKQRPDGGWGETFMSCVTREYVQHPRAQVVNTAWALLSLLKVGPLRPAMCAFLFYFVWTQRTSARLGGIPCARGDHARNQTADEPTVGDGRLETGKHQRRLQQKLHDQLQ